jgi:CubicO group peptidase (beta-lactamase class C family)
MANLQAIPAGGAPMGRRAWLGTAGALAAGACAGAPGAAAPRARAGGVDGMDDDAVRRWMRLASVPGLALATVGRGGADVRAFGVRRAGGDGAVTADTVFEAASLGKPVLAYLALRLAGDGVLELERPLGEYLALPNPADERARAITAAHVLSHTTGWRNWRFARDHALTADFEPGARFGYSGEGFYFLGRVLERLTGRGIAALARERVFAPLGMTRSSYVWLPELDADLAAPHSGRGQPLESFNARTSRAFHALAAEAGKPLEEWTAEDAERALPRVDAQLPPLPNFVVPNVAGSLMTSARDYAAFLRHLLHDAAGRAVLARMVEPRVTMDPELRWGLGVGLEEVGGRTLFWHWGDTSGFKSFVVGDAAAGTALVVFTNGNSGARVYERVVRAMTGTDHPAFLAV